MDKHILKRTNDSGVSTSNMDPIMKKAYGVWNDMHGRCNCNNPKDRGYYDYKDVSICEEWYSFKNFYNWFIKQDYEGKFIDKDILTKEGEPKVYSPETCVFVSREMNNFFIVDRKKSNDLPVGVHYTRNKKKYYASISINNKKVYLCKNTDCIEEAELAYLECKLGLLESLSSTIKDKKLKKGLEYQKYKLNQKIDNVKKRLEEISNDKR